MAEIKNIAVYFNREEGKFIGLTPEKVNNLIKAYPGVNILVELMKMAEWLLSVKGKDRAGSLAFITNWLNKAPITKTPTSETVCIDPSLKPLVSEYLLELWKSHPHILTLNTSQ